MARIRICIAAALALTLAPLAATRAAAQFVQSHDISENRTYTAIHSLENLIAYLQANPYSYGGSKEAAIASARATIHNLRALRRPHYWVPLGCCYERRPIYVR